MFSNEEVASYINENFEPAWESLRPVPRVTIDFGNGKVIRRTLHGNVATYVTAADGRVLDVLPGIYEPNAYVDRLAELGQLHRFAHETGRFGRLGPLSDEKVKQYHQRQAAALAEGHPREVFVEEEVRVPSIIRVESSLKLTLQPATRIRARAAVALGKPLTVDTAEIVRRVDELPQWKALADDTRINETIRRRQIHEHLAELGPVPPEQISKWLYREVLHADLEDPYLGLGKVLFDAYPFAEEDAD